MANVFDVAKYVLTKTGKTSTFKLQKLVYYSQAWSLVWDEKPLFQNKIYAWVNGPVCDDLYQEHKGSFEISDLDRGSINELSEDERLTIDAVINAYGRFNGQQLSNLTHSESPWIKARGSLPPGERGMSEIKLDDMVEYYSGVLADQK